MSNSSSKSGVENFLCNNATAAKISKLSTEISCDDFITIMSVVIREGLEEITLKRFGIRSLILILNFLYKENKNHL